MITLAAFIICAYTAWHIGLWLWIWHPKALGTTLCLASGAFVTYLAFAAYLLLTR